MKITLFGITKDLKTWCTELNIDYTEVLNDIENGVPYEIALKLW